MKKFCLVFGMTAVAIIGLSAQAKTVTVKEIVMTGINSCYFTIIDYDGKTKELEPGEWFSNAELLAISSPPGFTVRFEGGKIGGPIKQGQYLLLSFRVDGVEYEVKTGLGAVFKVSLNSDASRPSVVIDENWTKKNVDAAPKEDLTLNKIYRLGGLEFRFKNVEIAEVGYAIGNIRYIGVLRVEVELLAGDEDEDEFVKLEKYILNEKGERNADNDRAVLSKGNVYIVIFNVPEGTKPLLLIIGGLTLDLEKVLASSSQGKAVLESKTKTPEDLLPPYTAELKGGNEVRIRNPNEFSVTVGVRSGSNGVNFTVPANSTRSHYVANGRYDVYFVYSNEPESLYQGDSFILANNGVETQIVRVVGSNYGMHKVK